MQALLDEICSHLPPTDITFVWEGAEAHSGPAESENALMRSLVGKTTTGTLALAAGTTLWGVMRFRHVIDPSDYVDFAAAVFAAMADPQVLRLDEVKTEPIAKHPKELSALMEMRWLLASAVWPSKWTKTIQQPFSEAFHLVYLVRHVLDQSQRKAFNAWLKSAIARIDALAPRPEPRPRSWTDSATGAEIDNYLRLFWGQPIPPAALVKDIDRGTLTGAFEQFATSQEWGRNRFVSHPPKGAALRRPTVQ